MPQPVHYFKHGRVGCSQACIRVVFYVSRCWTGFFMQDVNRTCSARKDWASRCRCGKGCQKPHKRREANGLLQTSWASFTEPRQ